METWKNNMPQEKPRLYEVCQPWTQSEVLGHCPVQTNSTYGASRQSISSIGQGRVSTSRTKMSNQVRMKNKEYRTRTTKGDLEQGNKVETGRDQEYFHVGVKYYQYSGKYREQHTWIKCTST
ncbi:hypothetical protein JTB14_002841 [Gonioctena quinquepunctata]|nr:hypothetical protein JTB14_002841 [Gonioctena quinquepunctata]